MPSPRILLLDRPSRTSLRLAAALRAAGFEVDHTEDPRRAVEQLLEAEETEVLLGELSPPLSGTIRSALALPDPPEVILFEDFGSDGEESRELREGAFDTLARPVSDDDVLRVVRRALEHRLLVRENRRLRSAVAERFELGSLVSREPSMGRIFETLETVAGSRVPILLTGESGTGKTVLARALHERSSRSSAPFVAVNCGALPDSLLESELFGHARGAFTGAVKDRKGKFEAADGGTIFLDEIGTASPDLQVKLLRVLEEGAFERVGEETTRRVDTRLVAATNADLEAEVEAGSFRADLYYRIHVVGIEVPPLRARSGDVALLAEHFLARFGALHGRDELTLSPDALAALVAHDWPGNVRELENTLERAVLLTRDREIAVRDLWPASSEARPDKELHSAVAAPGDGPPRLEELPLGPLKTVLGVPERWLILRALEAHGGNRQDTARTLGINRTTLFNKMRKYHLLSFPTAGGSPADGDASNGRPLAGDR